MNDDCIKSVAEYVKKINEMKPNEPKNSTIFFRGTKKKYDPIVPSIYHKDYIKHENLLIKEIISRYPDKFANSTSTIEKLVIMQHYGLPTRLLDISQNPLVSLYFACKPSEDDLGIVNVFTVPNNYIKYSDSDTVSVISNLAWMDCNFDLTNVIEGLPNDCAIIMSEEKLEKESQLLKLIHQIRAEKSYFKCRIIKKHLDNYVLCVKPKLNNERIIAQQGAFFLFGMNAKKKICSSFQNKSDKYIEVKEIKICADAKEQILEQLDDIGINDCTIYPELDKAAKYIKENINKVFGV